jgi:formylglycine-generating enzyme required for sulfatase activity
MEQRTLGDYTLIKSIGQGTLGTAYLAEHRFMKRQYVVKILPEEIAADRGFIQRFEEDISFLSSLEHPNLVKIYNVSFAQGHYFLVTDCIVDEFGETTNLAQYMMGLGRKLEEEELFHILHQIAQALDFAHSKKIGNKEFVHRCLKPNNILVGKNRQGVDIYLSDFGISRLIGVGAVLTRTYKNVAEALGIGLQQSAQKVGLDRYPYPPIEQQKLTPLHTSFLQNYAFLAPEQKRLDATYSIDRKADIYAFGILTYFLLMNELPEGLFELPSKRFAYRYQWDYLLTQCLQYDPTKRTDNLLVVLESIKTDKSNEHSVKIKIETIHEQKMVIEEQEKKQEREKEQENAKILNFEKNENHQEEHLIASDLAFAEVIALSPAIQPAQAVNVECEKVATLKPILQMPLLERPQTDIDPGAVFQINSSVKTYSPERKEIANIKPLLTDMVVIQGGAFYRGSQDGNRDEMPKHQIFLASFAIDIHPVTNEQFVRFLEVMGGEKDSNHNDIIRLRDSRIKRSGGKLSIESGYSKHPVVGVTWYGAIAYAKWIGKRLPTEAEWEVAARGGHENVLYGSGDDIEKTQANFFSSDTTAVMSYAPNDSGIYDMAGNVYEWCYDWYGYNYYEVSIQEPENPKGPLQGVYRVLRGGCWKSLKEDLRCSRRHRNNPGTVNGTYGFRCVADVQMS